MLLSFPVTYELCQINEVARPGPIGDNWFFGDSDSDAEEDEIFERSARMHLSFTVNIIEDRRNADAKNPEEKRNLPEPRTKSAMSGGALSKKTFGNLNSFGSKKFSLLAQFVKKLNENNQEPVQEFKKQQLKYVKMCCIQNEIEYNYLTDMAQVKLMEMAFDSQQQPSGLAANPGLLARRLPRLAPAPPSKLVMEVENSKIHPEVSTSTGSAGISSSLPQIPTYSVLSGVGQPSISTVTPTPTILHPDQQQSLQSLAQYLNSSLPARQLSSTLTGPSTYHPSSSNLAQSLPSAYHNPHSLSHNNSRFRLGTHRGDKQGLPGFDADKKFRTLDEIPRNLVETDIPLIVDLFTMTENCAHEVSLEKALSYLESIKSKIKEARKHVLEFEG